MAYMRLGDLLIASGVITQEQLDKALAVQKETHQRLGDVLMQNGFITERNLIDALQIQLGVEFVDLTAVSIPVELARYVPRNIARKFCVVPVKLVQDTLYLAMSDPLDFVAQEQVKAASRKKVIPMIATRQATEEELTQKAAKALDEMMRFGTTTCEAKSGYGLALEHELKQLRAIRRLQEEHPMDVTATFMGAHLVPAEYKQDRAEYIRLVCEEMMPAVKEQGIAKFCDVFCEADTFTVEESRQILEAGLRHGLRPKIHADEIEAIGGSQLAGEIGAISAEHLIVCPPEGIASMAKGGVIACLLPATSFCLGSTYAPAREMVSAGVPVAMASDFNPGSCPCLNLQLVINLGCLRYRLTPEEVLTAVTLNAAAAIDMADHVGSVEAGKQGDLVIWDAPDLDYICYRFGSNLVQTVIKKGRLV